jgi:hypothetical protein
MQEASQVVLEAREHAHVSSERHAQILQILLLLHLDVRAQRQYLYFCTSKTSE